MTGKSTAEKTARAAQAFTRRGLFKGATVAGGTLGAVAAASGLGMPYIGTAKAQTTTWKIQTSWPGGFGLETFKTWANNIVEAPWMLIFPATFLALTLFAFNFVGDGLRDALDPKDR